MSVCKYTVHVCFECQFNNGGELRDVSALEETDLPQLLQQNYLIVVFKKDTILFFFVFFFHHPLKVSWSEALHQEIHSRFRFFIF